jgi:uncharacterized protein (DUF305 family)
MRWVIGFVASLALGLAANAQMNMGGTSMTALQNASGRTFDIAWMSQMIEHHKGALEMAKAELKDGKDARVKKAALNIVSDQSREIKQMTDWLKSWYNTKPDAKQTALMRADLKPMLEGGMAGMGADSDKSFLERMIPHHQSAVEMGKMALKKALRPELKTFAQKVINVQTKEIKQYQAWLKGWK